MPVTTTAIHPSQDADSVPGRRRRFALPSQFCSLPTAAGLIARRLKISLQDSRDAIRLSQQPEIRSILSDVERDDLQILAALSVVAGWQTRQRRDFSSIRLREASSPDSLLDALIEDWRDQGAADFIETKSGVSLRRRYDAAVRRSAKKSPLQQADLAVDDLHRHLMKHRKDATEISDLPSLRAATCVEVTDPSTQGDAEFFRREFHDDIQVESVARYSTLLGPLLPDVVWRLLYGTLSFLSQRESATGRIPLGRNVPTHKEATDRSIEALGGRDLREAVRDVSELIIAVIQFDARNWLRSQRTGLDADLAIDVESVDTDELCDAVIDLILAAVEGEPVLGN